MSTLMIPGFGWAGMRDKSTVILHTTFAWAVMLTPAGTAGIRDRGAVKVESSAQRSALYRSIDRSNLFNLPAFHS